MSGAGDDRTSPGIDGGRLSHAYIANGTQADMIAMAAVCSGRGMKPCMNCIHCGKVSRQVHPDVITIEKLQDKREIAVDQIREIKKDVIVIPCESDKKVYIVNDADLMNRNAQNAFLQLLEEPPAHAVFVLKTENPSQLLPTVRSRCVEVKTRIEPDPEYRVAEDQDAGNRGAADLGHEFFPALKSGNASLVALMFRLEKLDKDHFAAFLAAARKQASEELSGCTGGGSGIPGPVVSRAERLLIKAGEMLDLNVNTGHISGMICANLLSMEH